MADEREHIKIQVAKCTLSLVNAMHDAGGGWGEGLLDMTLGEFIALAAQNGIRFVHKPSGRDV